MTSVKTTTYVFNRFKMNIFFFKFKWKVLKQINPNLGGLSRGSFLPPYSNGTTSFKTIPSFEFTYISCICYIRLFSPISVLTKKMSRRKKSLYKIISKSIHVDTANIYLFKVSDVVLVFLLLTLNIFHTFFYCFYCWLWLSKC